MIYILLCLLLAVAVTSIVYYVCSNIKNERFEQSISNEHQPLEHVVYNTMKHSYTFYSKQNGKGNPISIEEFENSIDINDIDAYRRWFSNIRNKKLISGSNISIRIKLPEMDNAKTYKVIFMENKPHVFVFSLKDISTIQKHMDTFSLLNVSSDFNDFKYGVEHETSKKLMMKSGSMIVINIKRFTSLTERYGNEVGDIIKSRIKYRLVPLVNENIKIVEYLDNNVLMFVNNLTDHKEIEKYIEDLNKKLGKEVEIDNCKIKIELSYGVSIYGEFSYAFNVVVEQALLADNKASRLSKTPSYVIYDGSFEKEARQLELCNIEVKNVVDDNNVSLTYHPIINNNTGAIWGFNSEYYPYSTTAMKLGEIFSRANALGVSDKLKENIYTSMLYHYTRKKLSKLQRLVIRLRPDDVLAFSDVYHSDIVYSQLKVLLLVDLRKTLKDIKNNATITDAIKKLFDSGVEIGLIVDDKILRDYLLIYNYSTYIACDISTLDGLMIKSLKDKFPSCKFISLKTDRASTFSKAIDNELSYSMGEFIGRHFSTPTELDNKNSELIKEIINND